MRRILLALLLSACRADVDGFWICDLEAESLSLSLDQTGSKIGGQACIGEACSDIDEGALADEDLTLGFGCGRCALERHTLDVVVFDDTLEGELYLWSCTCDAADPSCACRSHVVLHRCPGPCGPR